MPTKEDHINNQKILKILTDLNLFPSKEELLSREEVLGKLNLIILEWIKNIYTEQVFQTFLI
jgi:poly(A) polymerase Pap1